MSTSKQKVDIVDLVSDDEDDKKLSAEEKPLNATSRKNGEGKASSFFEPTVSKSSRRLEEGRVKSDEEFDKDTAIAIETSLRGQFAPHASSAGSKNDKKKPLDVSTDSYSPRRRRKKTRVSDMASIIQNCGRESVMSSPPNNRRVSNKRARNKAKSSPFTSTPTDDLLADYRTAVESKDGIKTFDHAKADELRERSRSKETMSDAHFDQFKQATIDGLFAAARRGEMGDITPLRIEPYCDKIRSAKRGQRFDLLMLLCPKKVKVNGKEKLISVCPGDELPPGFDPNSCPTTRVLFKFTDDLEEEEHMTDDVRGNCQCGADGRCKKCTKDEGSARAEVYNRFALFFYVTGGDMSFYNLGGTTTRIKENLVSKLDRHYFHIVFDNGYHLSCATYLVGFFRTFENGATRMTANMKDVCDLLRVPQVFDRMVADNTIPMIVDPEQMDEFKAIWKAGLSKEDKERITSWKAENKKRMDWLLANANCSDSILSDSVPEYVLSYADFFKRELFEKNLVDSLEEITVSMVQSMQSSHGGTANVKKMVAMHGCDNDGKSIHFKGIGEAGGIETKKRLNDAKTRVAKGKESDKDRERIKRRSDNSKKIAAAGHVTKGHANWSPYNHLGTPVDPVAELRARATDGRFQGMHKHNKKPCIKWNLLQDSDDCIYLNDGSGKRGDKATAKQVKAKWNIIKL